MRPDDEDVARMIDMLDAARLLRGFVVDRSEADLAADMMFRFAVERAAEIVGEAARKVSRPTQDAFPQIPWQKIVQQRHIMARVWQDPYRRALSHRQLSHSITNTTARSNHPRASARSASRGGVLNLNLSWLSSNDFFARILAGRRFNLRK